MRFIDILVAVGIGAVIWSLGLWGVRLLARPVPPEPDPEDVAEVTIPYRCTICGMRLVVTHAADEDVKPPRHCREEMEAQY